MAIVDDMYILQLERLRSKLIGILRSKEMIVEEDEPLDNLIPMVDKISNLKGFTEYLQGDISSYENNDLVSINISNAFSGFSKLQKIKMNNLQRVGTYFCNQCTGLSNFQFNNLQSARSYFFYQTPIKNAILPSLTDGLTSTNQHIFSYCSKLQRLIIPNYTSSMHGNHFYSAYVTLKLIDSSAISLSFDNGQGMKTLTTLIFRGNKIPTLSNANYIPNIEEIYIKSSLVESLKTATNWAVYADKIKPIEESKYEATNWYENEDWYKEEMSVWQ